jgi:hypothetical protein
VIATLYYFAPAVNDRWHFLAGVLLAALIVELTLISLGFSLVYQQLRHIQQTLWLYRCIDCRDGMVLHYGCDHIIRLRTQRHIRPRKGDQQRG